MRSSGDDSKKILIQLKRSKEKNETIANTHDSIGQQIYIKNSSTSKIRKILRSFMRLINPYSIWNGYYCLCMCLWMSYTMRSIYAMSPYISGVNDIIQDKMHWMYFCAHNECNTARTYITKAWAQYILVVQYLIRCNVYVFHSMCSVCLYIWIAALCARHTKYQNNIYRDCLFSFDFLFGAFVYMPHSM